MNRNELILLFSELGKLFEKVAKTEAYDNRLAVTQDEYLSFQQIIESAQHPNAWFTPENVRKALRGIASWLNTSNLQKWLEDYNFKPEPKKVGIIMAGNVPLVGFHDFLCIVLSGNKAVCKLSSDDTHLWKAVLHILTVIDPRIETHYKLTEGKLGEIDAIIATGSDNSSRYFEYYFGKYPHIIRKNRTSVAVLDGTETKEALSLLGEDIFSYFGMGCRNVSQLLIPENFDLNRLFEAILPYSEVMQHHKYANNYDYNRAIALLNQENVLENGFVLLKPSDALYSPLSVLNYHRYNTIKERDEFLSKNKEKIQVVVGKNCLPFGKSQQPELNDFADNVNTLEFLEEQNEQMR